MSGDAYRTVAGRGRSAFAVAGSEFVGHAAPARSVAAVEDVRETLAAEYDDATHVVAAYRVRADPLREYHDDAGEPRGSAGKPALNVLQGRDLENVVAVVVRYYGGTDLGVGGLVSAYSRAVEEAVADAGETTERPHDRLAVAVEYDDSGTVRSVLESAGVAFEASYEERVTFAVDVPSAEADALRDRIASATSGRAAVSERADED